MTTISRNAAALTSALLLATTLAPAAAPSSETDPRSLPGFVDGSALTEFADNEGELVEVNLQGPILRMLAASAAGGDEETARLAANLKSIRALVVELREGTEQKALDRIAAMQRDLERSGWQAIAKVRDGDERVFVMILADDDTLHGLTVFILDGDELVFTNIAGTMRMEDIARIAEEYDVPGLDQIPNDAKTGER